RGRGFLIMQSEQGEARAVPMEAGSVAYVPPGWGHRTVNADLAEPFVLFFAFPADAGHDYDTVARTGFSLIVVHRNGKPEVVKRKAWHGGGG
ncbi:MAG: glucose-6-phosphate isomerase family protein, partial [Bacillota bacterium]